MEVGPQSGLKFRFQKSATSRKYLIETMGGGVAIFDFDHDGWPDVFFVNGAKIHDPQPEGQRPDKSDPAFWNRLFRNNHNGTFTDVTAPAGLQGTGYGMGVATGDYDNDGFTDLLVTTYGGAILYHNNGDGTFRDVTASSGIATSGWTTGAGFFDYDNDGCLDLVVARYLDWNFELGTLYCGTNAPGGRAYCHPDEFAPVTNYLFRGNCRGRFSDVSKESGISAVKGKTLGLAFGDYDGDGRVDIYLANDAAPQMLFHNNGNGTFTDVATAAGVAYTEDGKTFSGMGTVFADIDDDGRPDILTTALPYEYYAFFHNTGRGQFQYGSVSSRLASATRPYGGWGIHVLDFDNDGRKELFLANAHVMDNIEVSQPHLHTNQPPRLLRYTGGKFVDISGEAGAVFAQPWAARGAAFGDLDNDGDIDAVVTDYNSPAHFLRNEGGNRNHWMGLNLRGTRSNRDAIGARVKITTAAGRVQYAAVSTAGSYLSANDRRLFFGLGRESAVREIEIRWPSGLAQTLTAPAIDHISEVVEPPPAQPQPARAADAQQELERGLELARKGDNAGAMAAFRQSARINPDLIEAHFALGVMLARSGAADYPEALQQFLEVLRLNPSDADAYVNISNLLEQRGELLGCVAYMAKAVALATRNADLLVMLGEKQIRAFLYEDAATSFQQALSGTRTEARARYGLGVALKHLKDFEGASREFERVLQKDPKNADAQMELGSTLAEKGDLEGGLAHLLQATLLKPSMPEAWLELGRVYRRRGNTAEAAAALRRGLSLRPDQVSALYQAATVSRDPAESARLYSAIRDLKARAASPGEPTQRGSG
jgi:Flp pilus assembly protein TadD